MPVNFDLLVKPVLVDFNKNHQNPLKSIGGYHHLIINACDAAGKQVSRHPHNLSSSPSYDGGYPLQGDKPY